jgi:hypothetical protein
MSTQVQSMQKQIDQLRQEANIQRLPVSKAIEECVELIYHDMDGSPLVTGWEHRGSYQAQVVCSVCA